MHVKLIVYLFMGQYAIERQGIEKILMTKNHYSEQLHLKIGVAPLADKNEDDTLKDFKSIGRGEINEIKQKQQP